MIDKALTVIVAELNASLNTRLGLTGGDRAVLGLVPDATKDTPPDHHVTLSLVRVEEERTAKAQAATRKRDSIVEDIQPDIKLNLFLLASCSGSNYVEALKLLSTTVAFFQSRPVFDHTNCPGMDEGIQKLIVELYSQSFEEQNHLWGSLSRCYLPSALYRIRMLVIQDGTAHRAAPAIRSVEVNPVRV